MRSFSVILALFFAFAATSYAWPNAIHHSLEVREGKGNRNRTKSGQGDATKRACSEMRQLTKLTELAANQTRLDELVAEGKMNTAMVTALKNKAAEASTKLQQLSSNSTLTTECAAANAERKMKQECREMRKLQKFANMAGNQTALDAFIAKKKLNDTQVTNLKDRIQKAQTKIQTLSSNSTLTSFCSQIKQQQKGGNNTGASGSSATGGSNSNSGAAQQATKNSASSLGMKASYAIVPALVGAFVMLM